MCTGRQFVPKNDAKLNIIARYEKYCIESGRNVGNPPGYQSRDARGGIPTCSSQMSRTAMSAGLTPEMRPA